MPLLNVTAARQFLDQQQTYGDTNVVFSDVDTAKEVVVVPTDCAIVRLTAVVTTVFNAATTNTVEFSDGTTTLGTADISALGVVDATLVATAALRTTNRTTITATVKATGTAATTGKADVICQWVELSKV